MYVHIVETVTVRPVMKCAMMQHVTIDNFTARRFAMNVMEKYLLTDDKMAGCEGFALLGVSVDFDGDHNRRAPRGCSRMPRVACESREAQCPTPTRSSLPTASSTGAVAAATAGIAKPLVSNPSEVGD